VLWPGYKKKRLVIRRIALESTLPPHNDGAARRVSGRIESCFYAQCEFLSADLLACPSRVQDEFGPRDSRVGRKTCRLRCRSFRIITWSSKSRRQLPTQRSATPFCHGLRKAVRIGSHPMPRTAETTSGPNFASRSNSKNLCGCL
jgi:hypothetical protein